ncbi:MAG: hypothetical protein KGL53_08045 [Elusimicrobia bacterium]|nr:hypothetical protein [Elusimicrobiota bacterium]
MTKKMLFLLTALAASPAAAQSAPMPDTLHNSCLFAVVGTFVSLAVLAGVAALAGGMLGPGGHD